RAMQPHVFIRTLLAYLVSGVYVVVCCIIFPARPPSHWGVICLLCCVPAVIFYSLVRVPPIWLIASFGTRASRVIWSIFFGVLLPFLVILFLESLELYSSGAFL